MNVLTPTKKMENLSTSDKLKHFLASEMAKIDEINYPELTYQQHYSILIKWRDFDLLNYWVHYKGVFDGGEFLLNKIKTP